MRVLDRFAALIEREERLDAPAEALSGVGESLFSSQPLKDALSGTFLGHPLHPMLVTVPIGSWTAASVLDLTGGDAKAAQRLVGLGILTALPTAAAGASDWVDTLGPERRVGLVHAASNSIALTLYGASWLARSKGNRGAGAVLALAGAGAMSVGGWLGGHLSYALGVGVDTTAFQSGPKKWKVVGPVTEFEGDALVKKTVNGVSILITRVNGELVALANRCTHRGGPLSDGERSSDCVKCPWHGSVFGLKDGTVVEGPATRPQPIFDVRVTDGNVEVKRRETSALESNPVGA